MKRLSTALLALAMLGTAGLAHAVPRTLELTARLTDKEGAPPDGPVTLTFALHGAASGGTPLWTETRAGVGVTDEGLVFLDLGAVTAFGDAVFAGDERWLEITVNGEILTPRLQLHAVPFALRAAEAESIGGLAAEDIGDVTGVTAGFGLNGGGTEGDISLSVDTEEVQARIMENCPAGSAIRRINAMGGVTCEPDDVGVAEVIAGPGLSGGGTGPSVTLGVDFGVTQKRVTGTCGGGTAVGRVNNDGTVACNQLGDITAVNVVTNGGLTGGAAAGDATIGVDYTRVQRRVATTSCPGGIATVNENGTVACASSPFAACTWEKEVGTALAISQDATCPVGKHAISGGCDPADSATVRFTAPLGSPVDGALAGTVSAWNCQFSTLDVGHTAYALCCAF